MAPLTQIVCVLLASLNCAPHAPAGNPDEKPRPRLELRRAEAKPAEGLTEATVAGTKVKVYLHKEADLTGEDVDKARASVDDQGRPAIEVIFTKEGARKMARLSERHAGKPLAILIDGKVVSAPVVRSKFSARALITGMFSEEEAEKLAKTITGK